MGSVANAPSFLGVKSYDVSLEKQTADVTTDDSITYSTTHSRHDGVEED